MFNNERDTVPDGGASGAETYSPEIIKKITVYKEINRGYTTFVIKAYFCKN